MTFKVKAIESDDPFIQQIINSSKAATTGFIAHPELPHHYIVMFCDANQKTIAHRVLDAAEMVRMAHSLLWIVDAMSVDYLSTLITLNNAPEGAKN